MKANHPIQHEPGTYVLVLRAKRAKTIDVGALGSMSVRPVPYLYVGSAFGPGGVQSRVERHARAEGSRHWHVDYLRAVTTLHAVWYTHDATRRECAWAKSLRSWPGASTPLEGFGASDCDCSSHLVAVGTPVSFPEFRERIRAEKPAHAPLHRVSAAALPSS